jgi:hypothetical protein
VLDGRFVFYLLAALLVSCVVGAGLAYWAANAYIVSQHTGDPLQTQGGLKPSQDVEHKLRPRRLIPAESTDAARRCARSTDKATAAGFGMGG